MILSILFFEFEIETIDLNKYIIDLNKRNIIFFKCDITPRRAKETYFFNLDDMVIVIIIVTIIDQRM